MSNAKNHNLRSTWGAQYLAEFKEYPTVEGDKWQPLEQDTEIVRTTERAALLRVDRGGINNVTEFWAPKSAIGVIVASNGCGVPAVRTWVIASQDLWRRI